MFPQSGGKTVFLGGLLYIGVLSKGLELRNAVHNGMPSRLQFLLGLPAGIRPLLQGGSCTAFQGFHGLILELLPFPCQRLSQRLTENRKGNQKGRVYLLYQSQVVPPHGLNCGQGLEGKDFIHPEVLNPAFQEGQSVPEGIPVHLQGRVAGVPEQAGLHICQMLPDFPTALLAGLNEFH